jgi:hypothetical protein
MAKREGKEEKEESFPRRVSLFDKGIGRYDASQFKKFGVISS